MTDYGFLTFAIDVILSVVAISIATVFGILAHTWLKLIASSQVSEKTAMIWGYCDTARTRWLTPNECRRIEADIRSLRGMPKRVDQELQNLLSQAFETLRITLRKNGQSNEADSLASVFRRI